MAKRAFTLIELLVVVFIIGVLLAITSSVLSRVRQNAYGLVCQHRLRQLQLAFIQYDQQEACLPFGFSREEPTPPGGSVGSMTYDWPGWWWFHYLGYKSTNRLYTPESLLECPTKTLDAVSLQLNVLWGNYGVNWSLCKSNNEPFQFHDFSGVPLGISRIKNPTEVLLVGDSGYALVCWYHATKQAPQKFKERPGFETSYIPGLSVNRDRFLLPAQQADAIGGRHPNKTINVGYVDGHVERIKAEKTLVEQDGDSYRNVTPFWDPSK